MKLLFIILILFLLSGCFHDKDNYETCDNEISEVVGIYGNPEDIANTFYSQTNEKTYWYWSQGIGFTFTSIDGGVCTVNFQELTAVSTNEGWYIFSDGFDTEVFELGD